MESKNKIKQDQINAAIVREELRLIDEQLLQGCPRRALQVIAKLKVKHGRKVSDAELQKYKKFIDGLQKRKAEKVNDCDILKIR